MEVLAVVTKDRLIGLWLLIGFWMKILSAFLA
jgi:hypothetical protein